MRNVIVTAISLVPNWPPTFGANPFTLAIANAGQTYSGTIATNASDLNGGTLTCAKVSGPAWLNVAANGSLSGVPANANANTNTFVVSVKGPRRFVEYREHSTFMSMARRRSSLNPFNARHCRRSNLFRHDGHQWQRPESRRHAGTFAKVSGPAWLNVAADGVLSGQPNSSFVGENSFVVSVTDPGGLSGNATLNIVVTPAPPIVSTISFQAGSLWFNWSGGLAPYQVQAAADLPNWQNVGGTVNSNGMFITPSNSAMFYRIVGQ